MRRMTAAALALSICTFLSPGLALAAGAAASQQKVDLQDLPGEVRASIEQAATSSPQVFQAELVDANGKVVSTQPTTDGTFNFNNVPPGNYTVRVFVPAQPAVAFNMPALPRIDAGSSFVTVAAGATSNVTVGINAAAAAAAASAAAGGTSAAVGAGGSPGLFGMGAAGTVLAGAAAAGIITAVALTRNNDSSPSR